MYTQLTRTAIPCSASITGIEVNLLSNSTIMLSWDGPRCGTKTKAIPLSDGIAEKNFLNASNPPADATSPTMGYSLDGT